MKTKEKSVVIILAGVLLGLMLILFWGTKASAGETGFSRRTDAAESAYRMEVKDVLGDYGMRNAGVTMTKTTYDGVNINYSVMIHISSYNINKSEKEKLVSELNALTIDVDNAGVCFSFS